jgi:hypothetical protein
MKRLNTHIRTFDRPLQERPEVFHSVGVNIAVNIAFRVIDYLVRVLVIQTIVREQFIGHHFGALADVLTNEVGKLALAPRGDMTHANLSGVAFEQPDQDRDRGSFLRVCACA